MGFLISVYYPSKQEREEMKALVREENKALKKAGIKGKVLSHGGLLLALGRLWHSEPYVKAMIRKEYGVTDEGLDARIKALEALKDRPKNRPSNAKKAQDGIKVIKGFKK